MPLTAEYTWVESETTVQVKVPLKGQSASKLDVFATECYLKVSFPPYLLEVDLDGCIDSTQPKARVENGTLIIKARKKEGSVGLWGSLGTIVDRKGDPKVKARREESIKDKLKQEQELKERMSLRKQEDERLALRSQMSVEEGERRRIEDIKAAEKEKAEAEVYRAFAELAAKQSRREPGAASEVPAAAPAMASSKGAGGKKQQHQRALPPSSICSSRDRLGTIDEGVSEDGSLTSPTPASGSLAMAKVEGEGSIWEGEVDTSSDEAFGRIDDDDAAEGDYRDPSVPKGAAEVPPDAPEDDGAQEKEHSAGDADETPVSYVPAPRVPVGVVPVGFTTRLFPTPLRESKVADESAWIMKNRRHLHKNKSLVGRLPEAGGEQDAPVDISESDPVWLKGRGDDLYRGGDFLGAVNAYTAALEADPRAAACLSNRAACYLRLSGGGSSSNGSGNHGQGGYASACVADCGAALEILRGLPETGPSQARALARRSLAYRQLGHYRSSLEDCRAALAFSPGDPTLLEEVARGEPLARAEACKKEAATRFASGDIRGACETYTAALEAVPSFPSALSNRAACYLALGKPRECVRDCTAVLEMLLPHDSATAAAAAAASGDRSASGGDGDGFPQCGSDDGNPPRGKVDDAAAPTTGPNERQGADDKPALLAPSFSPPPPPPPDGSIPPPGSEKHTKWALATVLRRARANVQLEDLEGALRDYRMASSLAPGDKEVDNDLRELEGQVGETG